MLMVKRQKHKFEAKLDIVTILVTTDGFWIDDRTYLTL
jgi:hypothetical protein